MNNVLSSLAALIAGITGLVNTTVSNPSGTPNHDNGDECKQIKLIINGEEDKDDLEEVVDIDDMKPGDDWYIDKDLFVKCFDGKVYVHLKDLKDFQGKQTEPEIEEESGPAGPKSDLQNYLLYDLKVEDKVLIDFSDNILFPDVFSCWIPLGEISKDTHLKITQSFHFDINVTNWAQGDKLKFTEEFLALSLDAPEPLTPSGRVWNPDLRHCVPGPTPTPTAKPTPTPTSPPQTSPTPTPTPTLPPIPEACLIINFSGPPIVGTPGNDNLTGTPGNDLIFALAGHDSVEGNSGDDCILGGEGNDRLNGNNGNDHIDGGGGHDLMFGNNGDDLIDGGPGVDITHGGGGTDTCAAEVEFQCEL